MSDDARRDASQETNGGNGEIKPDKGRDPRTGRFVKGCKPGPGNPGIRNLSRTRAGIIQAVTMDDFDRVVQALFRAAERGEPWAIKEVLNRLCGKL